MRKTAGFTLVEMLVVIGIVVILAAILFPVASRVRHRARALQCAANLQELGVAIALYTRDYGDRLPLVYPMGQWYGPKWKQAPLPPPSTASPRVVLGDYVSTPETFLCPEQHLPYHFNASVSGMDVPPIKGWAGPAWTLLMYDPDYNHKMEGPHFGRYNMMFLDGHVKAYFPELLPLAPAPNLAPAWPNY